jgi:hypothetical protein
LLFPGSQQHDTIGFAYFLDRNIAWLRVIALVLVLLPIVHYLRKGRAWQKIMLILVLLAYGGIFYLFNFRFLADKMFYQPREKRDPGSWQFKSWVVGIESGGKSKAYDWNSLVRDRVIPDTIGQIHLLLTIESNNKTFHALSHNDSLSFQYDSTTHTLRDVNTRSTWQPDGSCTDGPLKGAQLQTVQAYQEFWHSWRTFHPGTVAVK